MKIEIIEKYELEVCSLKRLNEKLYQWVEEGEWKHNELLNQKDWELAKAYLRINELEARFDLTEDINLWETIDKEN